MRHLENMAKVMLATGLIVAFGYFMEAFMAWYGGNEYEMHQILKSRPIGPYAHTYWQLILCNCIIPQCSGSAGSGSIRSRSGSSRSSSTSACGSSGT